MAIVKASLCYAFMDNDSAETVDELLFQHVLQFFQTTNKICVCLEDTILCVRADDRYVELARLDAVDRVSRQTLMRSCCVLFAMCGKTVANNLDDICLNDYGFINVIKEKNDDNQNDA